MDFRAEIEPRLQSVENDVAQSYEILEGKADLQVLQADVQAKLTMLQDDSEALAGALEQLVGQGHLEDWRRIEERAARTEAQHKVISAYLTDVRQQITDIKRYQTGVDKKVGVALRFVDWYSDVKLEGSVPT